MGLIRKETVASSTSSNPGAFLPLPIVGNCDNHSGFVTPNNAGGSTAATYEEVFRVTQDCDYFVFVFDNIYGASKGLNNINIKVGIESPTTPGTYYQLLVRGRSSFTIEPGGSTMTDPMYMPLTAGQTIKVHTFVSVDTAGDKWPTGYANAKYVAGTTDYSAAAIPGNSFSQSYGPSTMLGKVSKTFTKLLSVGHFGDSLTVGSGDNPGTKGFLQRAQYNLPHVRIALAGERLTNFLAQNSPWRRNFLSGIDVAVCAFGNNDVQNRTLAQIQADMLALWAYCASLGAKVVQTTITPRTTSSNAFADAAGQTPVANFGPNSIRTQLNDWIRTKPSKNLWMVVDVADRVETARNSGIWIPEYMQTASPDGIHCNPTGHAAKAQAFIDAGFSKV